MSHIALYRKYRPQNFNSMIGHKIVIQILKNSVKYNKIHHCYLFSGEKGVGKTTLAKILAKTINCLNLNIEECECCDNCDSCLSINKKNNLDIIEIDGAFCNGVDDIRELKDKSYYKSHFLKYKIYIIDEIHVLSHNAFNALLKLLEEPPVNVIFILITSEIRKIPKTIISRVQHFNLFNILPEDIQSRLRYISEKEKILISDDSLQKISFCSNGSLRDSLNLLDQISSYKVDKIELEDIEEMLGVVSQNKIKKIFELLFEPDINFLLLFLEKNLTFNVDFIIFINDFIDFFYNLFINHFKEEKKYYDIVDKLTYSQRTKLFQIFLEMQYHLSNAKNKKNFFIINLIQIHQFIFPFAKKVKKDTKKKIKELKINLKNDNENNFIKAIKRILIDSDENTNKFLNQSWHKLNNYTNPELSLSASLLYRSRLLMISYNKEMLLSCENSNHYVDLLHNNIRNEIKKILNFKQSLVKDYFVILHKDWEDIVYPSYQKFLKTKQINDLDLSCFSNEFYKQNSPLIVEQNKSEVVKLARFLFGFDKVEICEDLKEKK
ncbi:DNA polymerase III subunit gamma/tau [Texas Phoenix palm phytoplasma]|uniref:DNA polymerase III subunit gamma/tau n=1 Tax=Texas Phoenix palm phytoplasma TaxID=176709 RepID=A0ABS5BIE2_9MOLU|nr:DNA polymerase III subunit gamma/tau [Texas Phoenix palm phytoplasma]MBP3059347.1 DNA polymerase III subunit gamma/tau [Texas Phoenix palm phytoplasma]